MPHQNIPETWVDWILGLVAAGVLWLMRVVWGQYETLEDRVDRLERGHSLLDERHNSNLKRLDSIDDRAARIEDKQDRLDAFLREKL